MKRIAIVLSIIILLGSKAFSQLNPGVDYSIIKGIDAELSAIYGSQYSAGMTINVDSMLNKNLGNDIGVNDPYRTLKDCYIFVASSDSKGLVGVYKNSRIIWHSDTLINSDGIEGIGFINTVDLNNAGKVDILTEWTAHATYGPQFLWIFSWDGQKGTIMNVIGDDGQSTLRSMSDIYGAFEPIDINGDGVSELLGYWPDDSTQIVYSWNGQLYGKWADTPQMPANGFIPRNKVDVELHASVVSTSSGFYYKYIIQSKLTSLQEIDQIVLDQRCDSVQNVSTRSEWGFYPNDNIIDWVINIFSKHYINPGQSDSNFVYKTTHGLPTISNYYVRGHNGDPMGLGGLEWYKDVLTNSAHGYTLGAADPPSPFVPLDFLDTLISYKHQCVTLGWLKDKPQHGKDEDDDKANEGIIERLNKAKTSLVKGDSVKARQELERFVKEVEQLYHKNKEEGERRGVPVLTSEGYALLKYNAEYLIDRLPEKEKQGEKR
ncbi:MAG: hypothetical protein ACYCVH_04815 [Ignavibacteriaceae bacterium]